MVAIFTSAGAGVDRGSAAILGGAGQVGKGQLGTAGGSVSVNAATGMLIYSRQDEMLIGRGPDAAVGLAYSTAGDGVWSPDYFRAVRHLTGTVNTAGSTISLLREYYQDNAVFTYDSARGAYVRKDGAGAHDELRFSGGVWAFVDGDTQTTEYFEYYTSDMYLRRRQVDRDGNTQTFDYIAGTSRVSRITNADGGYVEMSYNGSRPTQAVTYAAGGGPALTRVRYTWDTSAAARLESVTVDLSPADNSIADGNTYVTTFTYESSTSRRIKSITQKDGSSLEIGYDSSGRVQALTELVDASSTRTTTLAYHSGYTTITDAQNGVTTLRYDERKQLVQISLPPASAAAPAQATQFAYNAHGDVVSVTDAAGTVTLFEYDANGNQVAREDSLGNRITRTYGARNELLTETLSEATPLAFVTNGATPTIAGNKLLGSVDNAWGSAVSAQSYTGGAAVAGRRSHPSNGYSVLGLTDGALSTGSPYADYDYAFYFYEDRIRIWENGALITDPVASGASDNHYCQIEYDGAKVIYRINGAVVHETATTGGRTFHAGVSTFATSRGVQGVTFASSAPPASFIIGGPTPVITPGKILGGVDGVWATATTVQAHNGSAYVAGRRHHPVNGLSAFGLTDRSGSELDYAFYFYEGSILFLENGGIAGTAVANTATENDFCQIEYDGAKVTYRLNGVVVREVTTTAGRTFHGAVAVIYTDRGVQDFVFATAPPVHAFASTGPAISMLNNKILATQWAWGTVVSPQSYTGSAYIAARRHHPANGLSIFGLTDKSGAEFDYSFYFHEGSIFVFENGGIVSTPVVNTATDNDFCQIEYDGAKVIYRINGVVVREAATTGGRTFHAGVSTFSAGSGVQDLVFAASLPAATRYVYDSENHLRFVIGAEGDVTEYRYNAVGQQVTRLDYTEHAADVVSAAPGQSYYESGVNGWIAWMADKSSFKRTDTYYDARGQVSSVVSHSSLSKYGEGADSPLAIAAGAYTHVAQQPDGLYRITKTIETFSSWDAEAHSRMKVEGDFILQVRPGQTDKATIGGMSAYPTATPDYPNLDYGYYFEAGGAACFMEKGIWSGIATYAAGDNFWLERVGSTINYYKGATFAAAKAAGTLRTRTDAAGALYFDSSIYTWGGYLDAALTPQDVVARWNTTVEAQADGLYRVTKTGGGLSNWDADARSTSKADGDFVLRLRPNQNNRPMVGGVSAAPESHTSFEVDFGFYFNEGGGAYWMEGGYHAFLGAYVNPGDDFWLVRTGTTINYYKGATLEAAVAAGSLRTRTGAAGTFYYDSSFLNVGASMDVAFMPSPIVNGVNMTVAPVGDGLQRITKSGTGGDWDADARSTTRAEADFVLRLRPNQTGTYMMAGVSAAPDAGSSYNSLGYAFYFMYSGDVHVVENGADIGLGITYAPGDNFWLVRSGNSIGYYRGATLEAAMAAGALRTRAGVSGIFHFDSSFLSSGASMDVSFTPTESAGASAGVSRTHYIYDPAGQLLSRVTEGQKAETFVYDGLGRMVASKDASQGTTSIVFNDAANQTVVTLASGLVRTSTYDKAGSLISVAEGGSYVAGGTANNRYDKLGRLRVTTDATGFDKYFVYDKVGRLVGEVNDRGDLTEYRYDANDRLVATARYANPISAANLAILADPNSTIEMSALRPAAHYWDIWSWRTYDKEGRLTSSIDGTVRTYEYDKAGRLIKSIAYYNPLSWDQAAAFQANPPTKPWIPAADGRDSVTRNFYDRQGRLVAVLDGEGFLVRNVYDRAGQLVEKIAYATATAAADRASGTLAQIIAHLPAHADDRRTRFVYDGQGQLRFEVDALNQVTEYGYNGAGQMVSTTRHPGSIAWWSDGTYDDVKGLVAALRTPTSPPVRKSWRVYDPSGRLAYAIDAEGAVASYGYDIMGQVTKTVRFAELRPTAAAPDFTAMSDWAAAQSGNAANRVTRTYYNACGEARYTVDAEGYVSRADFDAAGRMIGEYRWDNPISVDDASTIGGVETASNYAGEWTGRTYTYAFGGELTDFRDGAGNWTAYGRGHNGTLRYEFVVLSDEAYTYYDYDNWGRVVLRTEATGAPEAAAAGYRFDGHGNLDRVVDPRGNATVSTFDHLGRVITETDAAGGVVTYEYNAFGDVTKVTDARGNATVHSYDQLGRLKTTTDALGNVTSHSYDDFGDLRTVTRGSAVTRFDYDLAGRVIKTTDAEGHYELYGLNAFGDRISVRNKIGGITYNSYDRRGLLLAETLPMASITADGVVAATSVTNKFEYDSRGNRTKRIEAFGLGEARTTLWIYDKADRLVETRGNQVKTISQASHNDFIWVVPTEKLKYDARSRVIEKTDALGGRTLYYYDKMSRVTAEIGPTGTFTAYTYDANGNMLTRRVYGTAVALPGVAGGAPPAPPAGEYRETSYTYDALNRLKTTSIVSIRTGAWSPDVNQYVTSDYQTATTTLDYDLNGNVVRTVDGNGHPSFAFYDKLNRKIAEVDREGYLTFMILDGEGNAVWEHRYENPLSGVTTASDLDTLRNAAGAARTTEFWYDQNGRRTAERRYGVQAYTVDPGSGALGGPGSVVAAIGYSYNGLGQVLRKTESNGDYVDYDYDQAGRLTRERRAPFADFETVSVRPTIDYSYDGLNALTVTRQGGETAGAADRITRYHYAVGGRLDTMYDANGAYYQYYYDAAGDVLRESYYRYKWDYTATLDSLLYTRDQLGRVTSQSLATWNGSGWQRGDVQMTAYNAYGDVAQRGLNNVWHEQFHYDSAGRLWKTNEGDGVWRFFVYDAAGNRTATLESEGIDLSGHSLYQVLLIASANAATYVGNHYADGLNVTIARYDRRGLQTSTRLPSRQLSGSTMATLETARTYNAHGEVTSETDARGFTTDFAYNAMGRLIEKKSPTVAYTTEAGAVLSARPTERYHYDVSGRLIATEDANGHRVRRSLVAGTGHGGSEALVAAEHHEDGGVFRTGYDVFGDARRLTNEIGQVDTRAYDRMGRITVQTQHSGLVDYYVHDLLGQRVRHSNSLLGDNLETTEYDMQGRVTSQRAFGGDVTTTSYVWDSSIANYGVGTTGGWTETTTYANDRQLIEKSDRYGRILWKHDLGNHVFSFGYDAAGRLTSRTGPETLSWSYYNTGLAYSVGDGAGSSALYGYDAAGNKIQEYTVKVGIVVQNAFATYDELGRMKSWGEHGGAVSPGSSTSYEYDLAGNIRKTHAVTAELDVQGAVSTYRTVDYWYRYDSMNRVVTDKGALAGGVIVGGTRYTYDPAGRRVTSTTSVTRTAKLWKYQKNTFVRYATEYPYVYEDNGGGTFSYIDYNFTSAQVETYNYDSNGHLASVSIAVQSLPYYDVWGTNNPQPGPLGAPVIRAVYSHDAMGRTTAQSDYLEDGSTIAYSRTVAYNSKGQVASETTNTRQGTDTWTSVVTSDYGSGSGYALGAAVVTTTSDSKNGYWQHSTTTTNSFAWWDGAVQSQVSFAKTDQPTYTTTYSYGASGQLASIYVGDGRPRTITFTTDMLGQVIRRDEADNIAYDPVWMKGGDPHEIWYRFNGKQIAFTGNNGTLDVSYAASIASRTKVAVTGTDGGAFRHGLHNGPAITDYDPSIEEINSYAQGSAGGGYTVRAGDSLPGIALALWGDASLWYKLAEANGLSGASALVEGRNLVIPHGVQANHHNAGTLKPYDPAETLGDTSPTTPKPQKKNKCSVFGAILLVAVGIAVTVFTAGAAVAALSPGMSLLTGIGTFMAGGAGLGTMMAAGAVGGALGSAASQGLGVAMGLQDKFSWKGVALAGLAGGISAGLGKLFPGTLPLSAAEKTAGHTARSLGTLSLVGRGAFLGASGSILTQGIGTMLGLQKKFDFANVAAAGLAGGASAGIGKVLNAGPLSDLSARNISANLATSTAGAIANATVRSLVYGTDFGDNMLAALPDIIGSTIGNMVAGAVADRPAASAAPNADDNAGSSDPETLGSITDPIDLGPVDLGPNLGALLTTPEELDRAYLAAGIDPFLRRAEIAAEIRNEKGWTSAEQPTVDEKWRTVEVRDTWHLPTLRRFRAEYHYAISKTRWMPGDEQRLADYNVREQQIIELDALLESQVRREIGGFLAAGILGGGTGAGGALLFGPSLIGGAMTAGASSSLGGVPMRWTLGQENSLRTFGQDGILGVTFYGAGRAIGFGISKIAKGSDIPIWHGSGPIRGSFGVNASSKSTRGLQSFFPRRGVEYIFDPDTSTLVVSTGRWTHSPLANAIGADRSRVVGGFFFRHRDGTMITNEYSGHFWKNWTPQTRQQFQNTMSKHGFDHEHLEGMLAPW